MNAMNLLEKVSVFNDHGSPRIIGELNGQFVKLAKFKGEMVWHSHENEDEYFQVIAGQITIHLRDKSVVLNEGECFIVPKGVEHLPEAKEEALVLMFEPKATAHTGTTDSDLTVAIEQQNWI